MSRAASDGILSAMGGTALIELRQVVPSAAGRVSVKLESSNPTGSMKDRMALAGVEAAEAEGQLARGQPVVEYTGGSTGTSLALVCAAKRHPLFIGDIVGRERGGREPGGTTPRPWLHDRHDSGRRRSQVPLYGSLRRSRLAARGAMGGAPRGAGSGRPGT